MHIIVKICHFLLLNMTITEVRKTKIMGKQAGAELGQAQLQLELGFTFIKVCCITLMITN